MKSGIDNSDIRKTQKVYIEWVDSYAVNGWQHENSLETDEKFMSRIVSIGFLLKNTKEFVTISSSVSTAGSLMDPLTIPKVAIKKFKKL